MNLNAFFDRICERAIPQEEVEDQEKAMEVLRLVEYSGKTTMGEVDFSSFTASQCKMALEESIMYYPDESSEEEGDYAENLLTEINRLADVAQRLDELKPPKRRGFF